MTVIAAILLGISLVFMGAVIIGDAAGWWKVDENIFGALAVILATASKWVSAKVKKTPPGGGARGASSDETNGEKTAGSSAVLLIFLVFLALPACATMSPEARASLSRYGGCVGNKALACVSAATGETLEEKAINYSACMAGHAVGCISIATAKPNPPGSSPAVRLDLVCMDRAFRSCAGESSGSACVKKAIQPCGGAP